VEFHKFYLTGCGLDNLKLKLVEFNYFIELWETLIFVKNESAQSHILITLRKIQVEQIVHLVYLQSSRQQIVAVIGSEIKYISGATLTISRNLLEIIEES